MTRWTLSVCVAFLLGLSVGCGGDPTSTSVSAPPSAEDAAAAAAAYEAEMNAPQPEGNPEYAK